MLRIIAGELGGRRIAAPPGDKTRPTSERVRESLFSMILPALPGARVLDLFAGSGALGFEALSRGAESVVFVDSDRNAARVITANIRVLGVARAELLAMDALRALETLRGQVRVFDVVFLDPPYAGGHHKPVLEALVRNGLLAGHALVIAESGAKVPVGPVLGLCALRERRYGDTMLTLMSAEGGRDEEDLRDSGDV